MEQLAQQQSETIDKSGVTDGFTGMSGLSYNAEQASLLASLSTTAIQNATDLYGKKDITFNDIGISDAETRQAWIDAGLAYEETSPDGTKYVAIQAEMLMDERDRRREVQRQSTVDTSAETNYDNVNERGGVSFATGEEQAGYRDDRGLSVRDNIGRRTQGSGDGAQSSGILFEQGIAKGASGPSVYNQSNHGRGVTANSSDDGLSRYDGSMTSDSEGNKITQENIVKLNGTAVLDVSGKPLMVYHGTPEMEYTSFEKGDIGFHLGTVNQARKRIGDKKSTHGIVFRGYAVIRNPIFSETDIGRWDAEPFSMFLVSKGIITDAEYAEVQDLLTGSRELDRHYAAPAAVRLREILEQKGYDGVAYSNFFEGDNLSYMIFHDDQFIRVGIDEYSADDNQNDTPSAGTTSVGAAPAGFDPNTHLQYQYGTLPD